MIKRICSVILTMCLTFSAVSALAYDDVETVRQDTAAQLVVGLGIMKPDSEAEFGSKTLVKRGELALYATKLIGCEAPISSVSNSYFTDVDTTTQEGAAVEFLAGIGAIPKTSREFNPNDEVTYAEAVRIILNCLGYSNVARVNGGYPGGYIKTANDCALNKGVKLMTNSVLTRVDAASILYNALFTEPMESDGRTYKKSDKTQLEKIWNVKEVKGIITACGKTALAADKALEDDVVEIDGELYNIGNTDIASYIGYNIRAYYTDDTVTGNTIVAFTEKSNANTVTSYNIDDITVDGNKVSAYKDGRKKNIRISDSAALIYNGRYYSGYTTLDEVLNVPEGEVTFIANNSSDTVNVIIVKDYKHLLVERVDKKSGRLYIKNGSAEPTLPNQLPDVVSILPDENDVTVYIDGKTASFNDLQANDAITMQKSPDGEDIILYVSRDTVQGKISGLGSDNVKIDGKAYDKSDYSTANYTIGVSGVFAVTTDGKLLGMVEKERSANNDYAYVLQTYIEDGPQVAYVELYTTDGEVKTYECADNIKVNGQRKTFDQIPNCVSKSELITYTANSSGVLTKINRPYDASSIVDYVNETEFIKNWNKSSVRYTDGIMGMSLVTDDTIIFSMPRFDRKDESDYSIISKEDLKNRTYSDVTCYDVDRQGRIGALVIVEDISDTVSMGNDLFFVKEVGTSINENDEEVWLVEGFEKGEEKTLVFPMDTHSVTYENGWMNKVGNESFDTGCENFHAGDALQYSLDNNGEVGAYRLVYNNDLAIYGSDGQLKELDEALYEDWSGTGSVTKQDFYDDLYISLGKVKARYLDYILSCGLKESEILGYGSGKGKIQIIDYYRPINLQNASVYVYNMNSGEIEIGDIEDVSKDDYVFVRSKKMGELNEVMVYSFE